MYAWKTDLMRVDFDAKARETNLKVRPGNEASMTNYSLPDV